MKAKVTVGGIAGLAMLYIAGPIVAGATRTGDREGPVVYPDELHTVLYIVGHEAAFQEKPRQRLDSWMYRRPLFYGLSRRLRSVAERQDCIALARKNKSPLVDRMIQMNDKANMAAPVHAPRGSGQRERPLPRSR